LCRVKEINRHNEFIKLRMTHSIQLVSTLIQYITTNEPTITNDMLLLSDGCIIVHIGIICRMVTLNFS